MERKILLLGSGFVSSGCLLQLAKNPKNKITVASNQLEQAKALAERYRPSATATYLDISSKSEVDRLVGEHNLVISLLPATLHATIAESCIEKGVNMVTTSYVSPALAALHKKAVAKKILILNEVGFDPGLDHLAAMKIIDDAKAKGGRVEKFYSWAAGLPAAEYANNPMGYKFSWSPQGVLVAAMAESRYLEEAELKEIPAGFSYDNARKIDYFRGFKLEGVANRDSLIFREAYGLEDVKTILRGTMRYEGFGTMVIAYRELGLLQADPLDAIVSSGGRMRWIDCVRAAMKLEGGADVLPVISERLKKAFHGDKKRVKEALKGLDKLGFLGDTLVDPTAKSPMTATALLLDKVLSYKKGERDLAFLKHIFDVYYPDTGRRERVSSTIMQAGDPPGSGDGLTAMARLVGTPCAVAAELVLDGQFSQVGVYRPLERSIYLPILEKLDQVGIRMEDECEEIDDLMGDPRT